MQGFNYRLLKRGDLWSDPLRVAALTLLAFAIFFALVGTTMLVWMTVLQLYPPARRFAALVGSAATSRPIASVATRRS
jgi:hypothetical protein